MMLKDVLAGIGMFSLAIILGVLLAVLKEWIGELIDQAKHKYQIKHRFDKPPTAKCYCIDCIYHDNKTERCWRFGETTGEYRRTADDWFCWEAIPRVKETDMNVDYHKEDVSEAN